MTRTDQYLGAIHLVQRAEDGPASTGAIADALDVSPASATEMVAKLAERGLVDHEKYRGAELTDAGRERARDALRTYCTLERFLANVLGVDEYRGEARAIEGVVDDAVVERLDAIVDRRDRCPDCFDPDANACRHLVVDEAGQRSTGESAD